MKVFWELRPSKYSSPWLVELIDAKGIDVWHKGQNSLKTKKMHSLMPDSIKTI